MYIERIDDFRVQVPVIAQGKQGIQGLTGSAGKITGAGDYYYSNETPEYTPTFGQVRFNNANLALATLAYINTVDAGPSPIDITTWLLSLGTGTSEEKSILYFHKENSASEFISFKVSGAFSNSGVIVLPLSYHGGSTSMSTTDKYIVNCSMIGDKGEPGTPGEHGIDGLTPNGFNYNFEASNAAGANSGYFRLNAGPSAATELYLHETSYASSDIGSAFNMTSYLNAVLPSGGQLFIQNVNNPSIFAIYNYSGVSIDAGSYRNIAITHVASNGTFAEFGKFKIVFTTEVGGGGVTTEELDEKVEEAQGYAASALASKNAIPVSSQVYATDAAGRATVANGQTYLIKATGDNIVELRRRTDASNSNSEGFYPSSSAVASNTSLIYQKFNEVFTPATISGWNYKAKGRGTIGSKRVQACIVFNVSAISYGGSPVNIKFEAKIISKSSNCLAISERLTQGRDSATPATGATVPMFSFGGAATLVKDVVYPYSVTESWSGVKSNYLHVFINFDPIDEDVVNDLIIYDAQLTVGGVSGIVGLSALYLPNNIGETTTVITSLSSPASTVSFANEKEVNAKAYTDTLLNYYQDNDNFGLHLATTVSSWYSTSTNGFLIAEDNAYLLSLGIKKQIKLNSGQFIATIRRDIFFRMIYPSIIDGKYIQTVYFIKTTDPAKFNINTCYVAKGVSGGQFVARTPSSTTAVEKSPGVWEIRNTFQAPSSGSYNEVWVGSSFTEGGTDNTSALSVSGFMSFIQSDPITYAKLSIELPDLRKRIKVNSDAIALIQANPLVGKKLGALGDSITEGHGTVLTKTYHELVAARNGMTSYNYGLSGTRLCDDRVTFGLGMSNPDRYTAMNADLDYITVWGGTNDILSVGVNSDMTRSTFKGALNLLCIGLIERYPTKKIGFLTPLNHKTPTDTMLPYADAILEICHRYAIPVLDLYRESGIYPLNTIQRAALMYTSSDYQHPNNLGHEILAAKYEAFLRRI